MNEMVERVAEALWRQDVGPMFSWSENASEPVKRFRRDQACVAIAAMRMPTAAMREAGFDAWDDQANSERVLSAWQAMIDEALAD